MNQTTKITCPQCGFSFDVEEALSRQVEERLRAEQQRKIADIEKNYQAKNSVLLEREETLKKRESQIEEQVSRRINEEIIRKEKELSRKIDEKYQQEIKSLREQENETRSELQKLRDAKIENERLKRQMAEQRQEMELEYEQRMNKQLKENAYRIQQQETEKASLKIKEYEIQLAQQAKLIDEMKRKAEQGSMQLQGEVFELSIEEMLGGMFPIDEISEVPKGIRGADVMHTVRNRVGANAGIILYESKRTKLFSYDWISKLKSDAVLVKADICVIVTEALPEDIEGIGQKDGVWICSYSDFKSLVIVLRDSLLRVNEAFNSQTNKGEKMQMLYDYLLSQEFRLQLGAIIDGFKELQKSYIQERNAMERIWKQREKQLEKVLLNTNHFIGSIQGIAGSSIQGLRQIGQEDDLFVLEEQ